MYNINMESFSLSDKFIIDENRLSDVCKYRQGEKCCKYIVFFERPGNFFCVKKTELKEKIDAHSLNSKGDNCQGLPCEE